MGTVVGIIQCQKFVNQLSPPPEGLTVIAFNSCLAGHGCDLLLDDLKASAVAGLLGQFIKHC